MSALEAEPVQLCLQLLMLHREPTHSAKKASFNIKDYRFPKTQLSLYST